jgi:predicted alpha/beta superfamily hydrolase
MRHIQTLRLIAASTIGAVALAVSASSHAAEPCKSTATGDIRIQTFTSTTFGDSQTLRIWLPPGYNAPANADRTYPVLLMLDGQNLFDVCTSGFSTEWQIDETLTTLIQTGKIDPLIVVGIDNPGARRSDEYLPYPDASFGDGSEPHGNLFPKFLTDEVMPLITHQLRIKPGPANTAIGGSSYGAIAALYALLHRPGVFGLGLLESTSLQTGNGELLRETASLAIAPHRVYVGVGTEEMTGAKNVARDRALNIDTVNQGFAHMSELLAANLKAANLNHPTVLFVADPGAHHQEKFWAARFSNAITFLFPKTPTP